MKQRSSASGKPARSLRPKSAKWEGGTSAEIASCGPSRTGAEAEVIELRQGLNEALERQRATAEVLSTISRSKFELQPILQSVAETASQLCRADACVIFRLEGGVYRFAVGYSLDPVS